MATKLGIMPYSLSRGDLHWELELEFTYSPLTPAQTYGPPELCEPAFGGELFTLDAYDDQNNLFELTPDELVEARAWIEANYDFADYN